MTRPTNSKTTETRYWASVNGSEPKTLRFLYFEDGGQTMVGEYAGQRYLVATEDYEPMSNRGFA